MYRLMPVVLALLLQGCGPITFTTTVVGQGTVQGSALGSLLNVFPAIGGFSNIDFAQNQDFQNNKTTREMVRSVKVTSLTARITDPSGADFGFIDSLQLTAKGATSEALFAKKEGIPQAATRPPSATVTFDVLDVDLATFVKEPSMSLVLSGKGRQPPQNTTIEVTVKLLIGASL